LDDFELLSERSGGEPGMPTLLSWLSSSGVIWFIAYSAVEILFVAKNGGATEDAMLAVARLSRVYWISWAVSCICLFYGFELFRTPEVGEDSSNERSSWEIRQGPCDDP
jgi:hypothetical protein